MITPGDDRPHVVGSGELWSESWYLDFAREDGPGARGVPDATGGFVVLSLYPNLGRAWWWAYLLTADGLLAVRDHEVPLPRVGLEIRAEGLWADLTCETPLEHWSVGLEAFGVGLDDPTEAWRGEWGERLPLGLDLEWELTGPPVEGGAPGPPEGAEGGYAQPGAVRGEILVGNERFSFDGAGLRARRWGPADWWTGKPFNWAGFVGTGGALRIASVDGAMDGLPERFAYRLDGQPGEAVVLGHAPVLVTGPADRRARLARGLCRFDGPGDGAVGWAEWLIA